MQLRGPRGDEGWPDLTPEQANTRKRILAENTARRKELGMTPRTYGRATAAIAAKDAEIADIRARWAIDRAEVALYRDRERVEAVSFTQFRQRCASSPYLGVGSDALSG